MTRRIRPFIVLAAAALVAGACTSTPAALSDPTITTPTSTTTTAPIGVTSTAAPTTTTMMQPVDAVTVSGDLPDGLLTAVSALLSWQRDDRNVMPSIPDGLATHLTEYPIATPNDVAVTGSTAQIDGGEIGVVEVEGGDILLAADEGDGWRIVGADPASGPAWFGEEPRMVMVIGSDARPGESQQRLRADSIHILTANPSEGTGTILGFPRDSYVSTPYGSMKFSSLMAGRGPQVMVDQVVDTWDLPVEGYVVTGFKGFEELMGNVGNLPIDLPRAIPQQAEWEGWRAGQQTLTPQRTLEYSRTRKKIPGGDLTRSANQGLVMLAVLQLLQMNDIVDSPEIIKVLLDHTWTSLTPTDLIQLAATVHTLDPAIIDNVVLPGTLGRAGTASVVRLTPQADAMLADLAHDGVLDR
ncbi:MAG TPA: LCP family protein [Acidimicrobiia bacterium]|nr:LCP family protein [Acidimicrobiia bacterium]